MSLMNSLQENSADVCPSRQLSDIHQKRPKKIKIKIMGAIEQPGIINWL